MSISSEYYAGYTNNLGDILLRNGFIAAIPEPTTLSVLGIGTVGLLLRRRKRN
ncbi:MAG: PEP-CTERM sorting domain-containing protein [Phycisphaerae bacterium]